MDSKKETEEQPSAVMPEALRKAIERMKGQQSTGEAVKVPVEEAFPLAAEAMRKTAAEEAARKAKTAAEEAARKQAKEEAWRNPQLGQKMGDGTIFIGQRQILGKIFNAYAAANDLPEEPMSYGDTVDYIATKYKGHGYDGGYYRTDQELGAAIQNNNYNGEWFIPPLELMASRDIGLRQSEVPPDTMLALKDCETLKGTFKTAKGTRDRHADAYWTSTIAAAFKQNSTIYCVTFSDTNWVWTWGTDPRKDVWSCRPVRLVELK